jgi:hypothetical protein
LLQGLVIQLAAVVIAHARTRPDHYHKVNLLVNGLVIRRQTTILAAMRIEFASGSLFVVLRA